MDKKDKFKDTEIISQKVVEVRPDKIKLKIKERVSLRKKKRSSNKEYLFLCLPY
jgi:hypothetical protein